MNPEEDHHRVIAAALRPPSDWRRPAGRPRTTWLRTIGEDLGPTVTEFRQRSARSSPPRRRRMSGNNAPECGNKPIVDCR